MTNSTSIQLPATISDYLTAHATRDTDAAIRAFTPIAKVVDQGQTVHGTDEILAFLLHAGAEFTYTSDLIGAQRVDAEHWVAVNRWRATSPAAWPS